MNRVSLSSVAGQRPAPAPTICSIYPHRKDKLRLINFPPSLLPGLRTAIQTSWNQGIQSEGIDQERLCYEVKLRGKPWDRSQNTSTEVDRCRLTAYIMRFMLQHGWGLEMPTNFKFSEQEDCWFFRKMPAATHVVMCAFSFSSKDMIRVIDGPAEVIKAVRNTIENHWYRGLHHQKVHGEAEEFKLNGRPWSSSLPDRTHATAFIMYLTDSLRSAGWTLYASGGTQVKVDSWVLRKSKPGPQKSIDEQ